MRYRIPLAVFIIMVVLLAYGLSLDPQKVRSPLIGKPAPEFSLARLGNPQQRFAREDLLGQVWVLNVWASWCVSCRAEHEIITRLSDQKLVAVIGLNYKDDPDEARQWLEQYGNPYTISVMDRDGRVGIDWGVYGVPETFIIGKDGLIKYKHIGPVTQESLNNEVIPVLRKLTG